MAYPVLPAKGPSTPFGARGYHWSCLKDSSGRGIHTGADWAAPTGTPVYAVVDGDVRYRSYGSAFGLQLAVSPDTPGEWFYAHLSWRVPDGTRVKAGDLVGRVGATGNVTGPHLHLEWKASKNRWFCGDHSDPWPEIQRIAGAAAPKWTLPTGTKVYLSKLVYGGHESNADKVSDSIKALQEMLNAHPLTGGADLPVTGKYLDGTDAEVIKCQTQHGFGADKPGQSYVGPKQAAHLLESTAAPYQIVNDLSAGSPTPAPGPTPWKAKAAEQLLKEVNAVWPGRDKRTDGWIGDANHTTGEHVPDPKTGVVRAIDIDADLEPDKPRGASQALAEFLIQRGKTDPRLYYVIHNGRIASGTYPETFWTWRPYDGSNPHESHIHVSFKPAGDNDASEFGVAAAMNPPEPTPTPPPPTPPAAVTRDEFDALASKVASLEKSYLAHTHGKPL